VPPAEIPGLQTLLAVVVGVVAVAALYFGREVLLPITLAVLLSFVLAPVVGLLRRFWLGRVVPALSGLLGAQSRTLMRYYWDTIETCVPPATIERAMDEAGFAPVADVLRLTGLSRAQLEAVVSDNSKARFELKDERVRAVQGHSPEGTPVTLEGLERSWEAGRCRVQRCIRLEEGTNGGSGDA